MFDVLAQKLHPTPQAAIDIPQAAVLILISRGESPSILYTKRAMHLRNHPGEVCFPGGMWEPGDRDLSVTALRETCEEIGLPASEARLLGCLPQLHTRAGTPVTPFIASFDHSFPLSPCEAELDSIFMVPLADFRRGIQVRMDRFERHGRVFEAPAYHYQGYEIWGFTAAVTAQLLHLLAGLDS